jgi:hypothetical protein
MFPLAGLTKCWEQIFFITLLRKNLTSLPKKGDNSLKLEKLSFLTLLIDVE